MAQQNNTSTQSKVEKLSEEECIKEYFEVLNRLGASEELRYFLQENLTTHELVNSFRRFQVAVLLLQGVPQRKIIDRLDISFERLDRVKHDLRQGNSGYEQAVKKYMEDKKSESEKRLEEAIEAERRAERRKAPWWHWSRWGT